IMKEETFLPGTVGCTVGCTVGYTVGAALLASTVLGLHCKPAQAVTFIPPAESSIPTRSTGGASRGNLQFVPLPDNSTPSRSTGGASRGNAQFVPPADTSGLGRASGGASRGSFNFIPPADQPSLGRTTGGASRNDISFIPPAGDGSLGRTSGGASRDAVFAPPTDNTSPQTAAGGASRTNDYGMVNELLDASVVSMQAITPDNFYGLTLSAHPTILTYLPASPAHTALFSLKDEAGNLLYSRVIPLNGDSGILSVQIPADAPALEVGQHYHWFLTLQFDDQVTPASPFVDAWIQRVAPTAEQAQGLAENEPLQVAEILAQSGIWYDAAATLSGLQADANEPTISQHWAELLTSVGLDEMVDVPLLAIN
ncbi:MAG: DUF928 domain-containing protein, partial [Cyanobacteria bacterium P01_F01_bin.4]